LAGVGVKLGLAVLLAAVAAGAARRFQAAKLSWRPVGRSLRVIETAPLGQQRAIHLVTVGQRTLLIAATQAQVVMLADVTGECPPVAEPPPRRPDFAATLSRLLAPRQPAPDPYVGRLQAARETLAATPWAAGLAPPPGADPAAGPPLGGRQ